MSSHFIPNYVPMIAGNEKNYLSECIETGWLSSVGPFVDKFERGFADFHGMKAACAVSSGTAAIHLGLLALGVMPGDCVLCPSLTFIGSVNPITYCGAEPVFIDIDKTTLNMDMSVLDDFFSQETVQKRAEGTFYNGKKIAAVIAVHLYGNPADMDALMELSRTYHVPVLEDAAESLGALYKGKRVGTIGDIGVFSFNGNKVITSGGGGMILSPDSEKVRECKHLSTQAKSDAIDFIHDKIGFNYRLSNLCAAVGCAQMEKLEDFIEKKITLALAYKELSEKSTCIEIVDEPPDCRGTYWMVLARTKQDLMFPIKDFIKEIHASGCGIRPVWYPIRHMDMYKNNMFFGPGSDDEAYGSTFCLPSSASLTQDDAQRVISTIENFFKET
ncbi:MAG: aminotransferase class I/II-fold pyridoxal phosphate-dependent enzyme [Candidatus Aureabacteria bacterium]|nr:aminotransferase class I/II-fold pyridoxal phosphate-dependent enzyme [Candidatus Auribacterota bacterium]